MSTVPVFELGIWNAWILMVLFYAAAFLPLSMNNDKAEKRMEGEPPWNEQSQVAKAVIVINQIIMPAALIASLFVQIKTGSWWFYLGLLIYGLGLVMVLMFSISFGTAPTGEPLRVGV